MRTDPQENSRALYQIVTSQGGYFTAAQALEAGYAYSQQHYHVERGTWPVSHTSCANSTQAVSLARNYKPI